MLNSIWFGMIALSVVCALMTGRLGELSSAVMDGAQTAVELSIFFAGKHVRLAGISKNRGGKRVEPSVGPGFVSHYWTAFSRI